VITIPGLGPSTIKHECFTLGPTKEPYHWWFLDSGPLLQDTQITHALSCLRAYGLKPPWVQCNQHPTHISISLPEKVIPIPK